MEGGLTLVVVVAPRVSADLMVDALDACLRRAFLDLAFRAAVIHIGDASTSRIMPGAHGAALVILGHALKHLDVGTSLAAKGLL